MDAIVKEIANETGNDRAMHGNLRLSLIRNALVLLKTSGLARALSPWTSGRGIIFTLHHVRPAAKKQFNPNGMLEITPEFLDEILQYFKDQKIDIVSLDEAINRLYAKEAPYFVCLTVDDAYRDIAQYADPIFQKYGAPYTLFVVSGFASRTHGPWWDFIERITANNDSVSVYLNNELRVLASKTLQEKYDCFCAIYEAIRYGSQEHLQDVIHDLEERYSIKLSQLAELETMSWDELRSLKQTNPKGLNFGAHTHSHAIMARLSSLQVQDELQFSSSEIERELGVKPYHFAYPVGDSTSAASREFILCKKAGYVSALTTRPGVLFDGHLESLHALPRISINGNFQTIDALKTLMTGAPFILQQGMMAKG